MEIISILISILALLISFFGYRHSRKVGYRQTKITLEQKKQSIRLQYHDIGFKVLGLVEGLLESKDNEEALLLAEKFTRGLADLLEVKKKLESLSFEPGPFKDYAPVELELEKLKGDTAELTTMIDQALKAHKQSDFKELKYAANGFHYRIHGSKNKTA
jgi:hypothetical protein